MQRWLLAVTALTLGIGLIVARTSESAALQQTEYELRAATSATGDPSAFRSPTAPIDNVAKEDESFETQIETWIRSLANQDEFKNWQGAAWTRYPLGPGMHGWIILLHKDNNEIGYLVVGATEDGNISLIEYGAGENPLFSKQTLYRSLIQHELIHPNTDAELDWLTFSPPVERIYYSPLHAVWKWLHDNESIFIDAKTGELLPLSAQHFLPLQPFNSHNGLPNTLSPLVQSLSLDPFDPYANTYWIQDNPLTLRTSRDLLHIMEEGGSNVTFTANLYGKTVLVPFAVTGFQHRIRFTPYIRLEQAGGRYVPFDVLLQYGSFYKSPRKVEPLLR